MALLAPGTGMDIIARLYGEQLSASLGKPVVVENKPGAGFLLATQSVLSAPADGHMLYVAAPPRSPTIRCSTSSCPTIPTGIW